VTDRRNGAAAGRAKGKPPSARLGWGLSPGNTEKLLEYITTIADSSIELKKFNIYVFYKYLFNCVASYF